MVLDVSGLRSLALRGTELMVGAGATTADIETFLDGQGRMAVLGTGEAVASAGFCLGGGFSLYSRRYGLGADQLLGVRLVDYQGRLIEASPTHHEDLFWALQGAGAANFGVVTSLRLQTHPVPPIVTVYNLRWPLARAAEVADLWFRWAGKCSDRFGASLQLAGGAHAPLVSILGIYLGGRSELESLLPDCPEPKGRLLSEGSYSAAVQHYSGSSSLRWQARSNFLDRPVDTSAMSAIVEELSAPAPCGVHLQWNTYGGAIARVAPEATSFFHRRPLAAMQALCDWQLPQDDAASRQWLKRFTHLIDPLGNGHAYQNHADELRQDWARAYFGSNLERLQEVKQRYDPHGFFRSAQGLSSAKAAQENLPELVRTSRAP